MRSISLLVFVLTAFFMVSCGSNKNKPADDQFVLSKEIPFGMALVSFQIAQSDTSVNPDNQIRVKVLEVYGYGASAGILEKNRIINLVISSEKDKNALNRLSTESSFRALVKKQPPMAGSAGNTQHWELVEIQNK